MVSITITFDRSGNTNVEVKQKCYLCDHCHSIKDKKPHKKSYPRRARSDTDSAHCSRKIDLSRTRSGILHDTSKLYIPKVTGMFGELHDNDELKLDVYEDEVRGGIIKDKKDLALINTPEKKKNRLKRFGKTRRQIIDEM